MSLDDDLLRQRYDRIQQIQALGFRPYGQAIEATHALAGILKEFSDTPAEALSPEAKIRIVGRIQTIRRMGKAGFAHLQQKGARLQVYFKKDLLAPDDYELFTLLDVGDTIGVDGYLFRTRTGELSVHAEKLYFLSKILLTLPEKFHGLEDVEIRYRQRYLDLIANPEVQQTFIARAKIIQSIRRQLTDRGFIEVETPMMQPLHGGATAKPFTTHHNTLDLDLYLRIAPELYLKRLIVGGFERVFEINRNFRNEGISTRHNPEFTMLEFYQAYSDYRRLMDLSEELLRQTVTDIAGSTKIMFDGKALDFSRFRRYSMREAVVEFWPHEDKPTLDQVADPAWLAQHSKQATAGHALTELFERYVEPKLFEPTFIYDYPVETSPLSKTKEDDPGFVERFEIYIAGMEIGNAYTELNDPQEQRRRFEMQIARKATGDEEAHVMDEDYIRALCYGMPPTGGEGIGIDRLTMILTDSRSIRDVILFPLLRPEGEIGIAGRLRDLEK